MNIFFSLQRVQGLVRCDFSAETEKVEGFLLWGWGIHVEFSK